MASPGVFWKLGHGLSGHNLRNSERVGMRRYKAMFGVTPNVCHIIWKLIQPNLPKGSVPIHLLWALYFLKNYNSEEVNRVVLRADEKTIRKWVWVFVDHLSRLRVVSQKFKTTEF